MLIETVAAVVERLRYRAGRNNKKRNYPTMALTKADIAESLFNELGLNKREARELVDSFFEDLRSALAGR